ncbi:MAG: mannose-1-phosphate guanylyltransferase/mannose-6-phosphate isomerase [Rhizobiales bacterium]|nr:mannose-1-phosphate guanylyltransferase/mannose-6-phosphate isomerase [Hyphomicrobiales bacterium]
MTERSRPTVYPVVLSGGSGTRLWPLSRQMYPKQFLRLAEDQELTFLQASCRRLADPARYRPVTVVGNVDHRFLVSEQLAEASLVARRILLEPVARNTGPAIAAAALEIGANDPDAVLVVMPSDHVIADEVAFAGAVDRAVASARTGRIVLFGIRPERPETGYGYIEAGMALAGEETGLPRTYAAYAPYDVVSFREKPDAETARRFVSEGRFFWNSGIFVFRASDFLAELMLHAPEVVEAARRALEAARQEEKYLHLDPVAFASAPSISVDYCLLEHTLGTVVIPVDVGWSDVGAWSAVWDIGRRDDHGNVVNGTAFLEDAENCYVHSETAIVAAVGVRDLVIVDTPDAILVTDRSRSQDVSRIVKRIASSNRREHEQHLKAHRPWGFFQQISNGGRFQVKLLHVNPGGRLSMQMHHHRSEHWVVVKGTARVTCGDSVRLVRENESVYINATEWHRLENPGKVPLELIEVQIGSYLGEDDIIRGDDVYNRTPEETK